MENRLELHIAKYANLGIFILASTGASYLYFYVLYPFVIWKLGLARGGILMAAISFIACYAALMFYYRTRKDWFGIEAIKEKLDNIDSSSRVGRFFALILKKSRPLALVALSIKFDPFVTTVCMRPGSVESSGLTRKDWLVFILSVLIGNGYWLLVISVGGSILKHL
jgi:hypothetical protein